MLACCAVPLHLRWLPNSLKSQHPSISTLHSQRQSVVYWNQTKKRPLPSSAAFALLTFFPEARMAVYLT
jgi:hypothetical protein